DFWVCLRVPRTRHECGRCDKATGGHETNKKALAIHVSGLLSMRDGRFATPRFNAAVDVARVQKPGAKLLGESAERKKDFSEISAYRNSITRRGNRRHAAENGDELASLHSITSSASSRSDSGIVRPSALAVVKLTTRSNLVGCSIG